VRAPLEIARLLGWPEAKADDVCLHLTLAGAHDCPTCGPVVAAQIRRATELRLRVWRHPVYGDWWWRVGPLGDGNLRGIAATHGEALAVGLAALETASVRTRA
jgi:hypothetical protein